MTKQLILPGNRAFNSNGFPAAGATAKLYQSGTLTPVNFLDENGDSLGSTITANAAGRYTPMPYQDETTAFRLIIADALGNELDDVDPFYFGSQFGTLASTAAATVATRSAMAAVTGAARASLTLSESGREGTFVFDASDLSAEVTADTEQGVYVAPSTDTTGASGAWVRKLDDELHGAWFGLDGVAATDATDALNALAAVNNLLDKRIVLPPGTHTVSSDTVNGSGVLFSMPPSNTLRISGPGATIKRANVSAGQMADTCRVVRLEATEGGNYILEDFTVDGNEANVPYNAASPFEFEHASNVIFVAGAGGSGVTLGDITTRNLVMKNAVGDGFNHNWPYRNAFHDNFVETDRPRRTRAGMQLGLFDGITHIKGGSVTFLESEAVSAVVAGHKLILEGVIATENFDLGGFSPTVPLNITMIGCKALLTTPTHPAQRFNLGYCKGEVIDCDLKGTDMVYGASQIFDSQLNFRGGSITIPVNPADATMAIPIMDTKVAGSYHRFFGTRFYAPSGITSFAAYIPPYGGIATTVATGVYLMPNSASTTGTELTAFYDCISDENLPFFYYARNSGMTVIDGGSPRGKTAVCRYATSATFVSNVVIRNPEQFPKSGLGALFTFGSSAGTGTISVSGSFDGELMNSASDGTNPAGVTWNVDSTMLVTTTPVGKRGLPGMRATMRIPAAGAADLWTYRNGSTAGSTTTWDTELRGYGTNNIGYATGAGGTVTQATSKATGVTLNKLCGEITLNAAALAANTAVTFTLTNSTIAAGDRIALNHMSGGTFGAYLLDARSAAGSATIMVRNVTAGSLSEAAVIGFAVVKAVTA